MAPTTPRLRILSGASHLCPATRPDLTRLSAVAARRQTPLHRLPPSRHYGHSANAARVRSGWQQRVCLSLLAAVRHERL